MDGGAVPGIAGRNRGGARPSQRAHLEAARRYGALGANSAHDGTAMEQLAARAGLLSGGRIDLAGSGFDHSPADEGAAFAERFLPELPRGRQWSAESCSL